MSLAEELLADLEDDDPEEEAFVEQAKDDDDEQMDVDKLTPKVVEKGEGFLSRNVQHKQPKTVGSCIAAEDVREVAKLHDSPAFRSVLSRIREFSSKPRDPSELCGPVEADPEYRLIVEANNLAAEVDEEIATVYKFAKDRYTKRFPELETLVVQPLEYLLAAKELGNNVLRAKNNKVLEQFLTQATIMVVSVTASTTQG